MSRSSLVGVEVLKAFSQHGHSSLDGLFPLLAALIFACNFDSMLPVHWEQFLLMTRQNLSDSL